MEAKVKDYPGTGCPICWTRKNLNECIAGQYLTVQELVHMISHWRSALMQTGFGGEELRKEMKELLEAAFAYYESVSKWRMAHENSELENFRAEDYQPESLAQFEASQKEEENQFAAMMEALGKVEAACRDAVSGRSKATEDGSECKEESEDFAAVPVALEGASQALEASKEARLRYGERLKGYAQSRRRRVQVEMLKRTKATRSA